MKNFLDEAKSVVPRSVWFYEDVGHTQEAMTEQKIMFENPFGTPKPERLIKRILEIATNENDLVLDSFLGSGTTAVAAIEEGVNWIGCERELEYVAIIEARIAAAQPGMGLNLEEDAK